MGEKTPGARLAPRTAAEPPLSFRWRSYVSGSEFGYLAYFGATGVSPREVRTAKRVRCPSEPPGIAIAKVRRDRHETNAGAARGMKPL
jgi:hypothetical protein